MHWNMTEKDIEFMLNLEPQGCFVLFRGGDRFGIATSISYGKMGWLGNLIVREDVRREGAGSYLVQYVLNYLRKKGIETIGLYAYPSLVKFYEKFGFKSNTNLKVLNGRVAYPADQVTLRTANRLDVGKIVNLDKQCFGTDRKRLLEAIILGEKNLCYFLNGNEIAKGYIMAKIQDKTAEIGPLVCEVNSSEQALLLLEAVLSKLNDFETFIYIPRNEVELLKVAYKAGLKDAFQVVKMISGFNVSRNCIYTPESLERG